MRHRHITRAATLGLAVAAIAAPAASAQTAVQSPDARDANQAAIASHTTAVQSPDARDANLAARGVERPTPRFVVVPGPAPASEAGGLHWDDAGIGAAGLLGLVVLGAGGVLLAVRRRPERAERAHPVV
jgi:hypothetical protein